MKYFEDNCLGKSRCEIPLEGADCQLKDECQNVLNERRTHSRYDKFADKDTVEHEVGEDDSEAKFPEPVIIALAPCTQEQVTIHFMGAGEERKVNKSDFGIFVVLMDFVVVLILIGFVSFLDSRQKEFAEAFADQTIEMSDFCMRFNEMPTNAWFDGSDKILKTKMWNKILAILED